MFDALQPYIAMASGITEATAGKAKDAVTGLIAQGMSLGKNPATESVQSLADDLLATSEANRAKLLELIRTEIDKAAGRMGFVREDELAALRARVEKLEGCCAPKAEAVAPAAEPAAPTADASTEVPVKRKKIVVEEGQA